MDPTPEQVAAAKAKADEAMAKLKAGVKWQDVAKQYSSGPTAQEGGDLGFFKRGLLEKWVEEKPSELKKGETRMVARTRRGLVRPTPFVSPSFNAKVLS